MTKKSTPNKHKISWPMKLAFALAFLPVCLLIIALTFKLPLLPSPPFINLLGENSPEHILFFAYSAKNIPSSVAFTLLCFAVGISLLSWLTLDRGSIKQVYKDLVKNLKEDFNNLLNLKNYETPSPKQEKESGVKKESVVKVKLIGKTKITNKPSV